MDGAIAGRGPAAVTRAAGLLALIAIVQGFAVGGRHLLFSLAGERGVRRVRERLYQRLLDQEIGFFDSSRTGELISRLGTDSATIQSLVAANVSMVFRHVITALGGIALLFVTSPRLTRRHAARRPAHRGRLGRSTAARSARSRAATRTRSPTPRHVAEESLSAMRTVRAFNAEPAERARYDAAIAESYEAARRRARAGSLFMGGASAGVYLAIAAVLGYGGRLVARGDLSAGALTAFLVYTLLIAMSLGCLADLWAETMKGIGAAERVFALMDRVPEMPVAGGLRPARCEGRIALEGVRFAYPARPDVEVLGGIDLAHRAGRGGRARRALGLGQVHRRGAPRPALRSRSPGGSRSTATTSARWTPPGCAAQIGVVPQEPTLFSASVEENVRYGRPGATHEEVVAACRAAHADAFVRGFPEGYATRVGERGQQLSGGQRQRLAIARAVLKDPRILLLDEATSALDAESEALVKDALARLMTGRTTVIIAHRLSTVASADRVVVIEGGMIVESGPHRELVARGGLYQRLVERQLRAG